MADANEAAAVFVEKRAAALGFPDYPGPLPATLDEAYAVQSAAIARWPDGIAGWKVGRIPPALSATLGADRFIGPVFGRDIVEASAEIGFPAFVDGFAAFEAELVIIAAADAPADELDWTTEEAAGIAGAMHIGIEVAGSPLASINDLGSLATIAGFGNNNGEIMGPEVTDWRSRPLDSLVCTTTIDGVVAGKASADAIPGGPLAALAFALGQAARLGRPVRKGELISTGAITGVHAVSIGQACEADFAGVGTLRCTVVAAKPRA